MADAHPTTEYDKALALQNYFRDAEALPPTTRTSTSASRPTPWRTAFNVRRGFCEQFAGTYAAIAHAVGLPTHVAVGFQPGAVIKQGTNANGSQVLTYSVTTKEAHAWPEVYFPQVGWIAFEPTPGRYDYDSPGDPNGTHVNAPPYVAGGSGPGNGSSGSDHHRRTPTTVPPNSGSSGRWTSQLRAASTSRRRPRAPRSTTAERSASGSSSPQSSWPRSPSPWR